MSDSRSVMHFHVPILVTTNPFLSLRPFQGSWNYSEVVQGIIFFPLHLVSLHHTKLFGLSLLGISVCHRCCVCLYPCTKEWVWWSIQNLKITSVDLPSLTSAHSCPIFNHMKDWSRNRFLHSPPHNFTGEKQYTASCAAAGAGCSDGSTCRWFWSKGSGRKEWETG